MNPHRLQDLLNLIRRADSIERLQEIRAARLGEIDATVDALFAERAAQIKAGQ